MFRLKHIPTGLYYQPLSAYGSHLSKRGKIYHTEGMARGVFPKYENIFFIEVKTGTEAWRILLDHDIPFQPYTRDKVQIKTNVTKDWRVEEVKSLS